MGNVPEAKSKFPNVMASNLVPGQRALHGAKENRREGDKSSVVAKWIRTRYRNVPQNCGAGIAVGAWRERRGQERERE